MNDRLPQFVVIGAIKAATTWIAHQLRYRDDVFMPGPEPHYFSRCYDRGEQWYRSLFAEAGPNRMIGEKSADYLSDPAAPRRMAALLPAARLVAQLRNPVERAYSDYCMLFRRGQIDGDIDRHLDRSRTAAPRFLENGLYGRHIARFLDHFPESQLKVILHDEVKAYPDIVIADVCEHVGLPTEISAEASARRVNDGKAALVPLPLRLLPQPLKTLVRPLRGNPLFEAARGLIARPVEYPPLRDDMRRRLADFYGPDVERLGGLLGRDLTGWVSPAGTDR